MHAIVETGGKQFRVAPGDVLRIPKLEGEIGTEVQLGRVLAVFSEDGESKIGSAAAAEAKVNATISDQDRASKILVFKFKRKKQYKRTIGHRQYKTHVKVSGISV